jgi:hypothetical protein
MINRLIEIFIDRKNNDSDHHLKKKEKTRDKKDDNYIDENYKIKFL